MLSTESHCELVKLTYVLRQTDRQTDRQRERERERGRERDYVHSASLACEDGIVFIGIDAWTACLEHAAAAGPAGPAVKAQQPCYPHTHTLQPAAVPVERGLAVSRGFTSVALHGSSIHGDPQHRLPPLALEAPRCAGQACTVSRQQRLPAGSHLS